MLFVALLQPASAKTVPATTFGPAGTGVTTGVMDWGGRVRHWRTFVPSVPSTGATPATRLPVLVLLHPAGGTIASILRQTSMDRYASDYHFITVTPLGAADGTWNAGSCCATARDEGTDDVGFIGALITRVVATSPADPDQVYVAGASNGGMLAYAVACGLADRVDAVFSAGGAQTVSSCHPSRPVTVVEFHSLLDTLVPAAGGVDPKYARPLTSFQPTATTFGQWSALDHCSGEVQKGAGIGETLTLWYGCGDGTLLEIWMRDGGGHEWPVRPGAPVDASETIAKAIASKALVRHIGQPSANPITS